MRQQLQLSRVLRHSATIALLAMAAIITPIAAHLFHEYRAHQAAQPDPRPATEAEQLEIVRALLQTTTYEGVPPPPPGPGEFPKETAARPIILLSSSVAFCGSKTDSDGEACTTPHLEDSITTTDPYLQDIPRKIRQELVLANRNSSAMPNPGTARVIYQPRATLQKALAGSEGWRGFYAAFPHSAGLLELSRATLSSDGTHALIYAAHSCDGLCGSGQLHYLIRKDRGGWQLAKSITLWVS